MSLGTGGEGSHALVELLSHRPLHQTHEWAEHRHRLEVSGVGDTGAAVGGFYAAVVKQGAHNPRTNRGGGERKSLAGLPGDDELFNLDAGEGRTRRMPTPSRRGPSTSSFFRRGNQSGQRSWSARIAKTACGEAVVVTDPENETGARSIQSRSFCSTVPMHPPPRNLLLTRYFS